MMEKHYCCARLSKELYVFKCGNPAKYERDGKHYCGMHDPIAKQKKSSEKAEKAYQEDLLRHAEEKRKAAEQKRRADCYDDMLKELKDIVEWHKFETIPLRAREIESIKRVIAKVTGEKL